MTPQKFGKGRRVRASAALLRKVTLTRGVLVNTPSKGSTVISKKVIAICAVVGVAVSGFALTIPAQAEPVAPSLAIVGSDTLEDVVNALVNGYTVGSSTPRAAADNKNFGSFDASGTTTIVTTTGGVRFGRPNGSGDGRKALLRSIDGTAFQATAQLYPNGAGGSASFAQYPGVSITGQVDMARASSLGTASATGVLLATPFGRDAISYVYDSGSAAGIESLTKDQLKLIFEGVTPVYASDGSTRIKAITPQTGSGTGSDWAGMISANKTTTASSVAAVPNYVSIGQEHDASTLPINTVMPMSASRWVAYNTGGSAQKKKTTTLMGTIDGISAVTGACTAVAVAAATGNLCTTMAPASPFYSSTFGRDTYIVVEYARRNQSDIAQLLDPTNPSSLTNTDTFAGSTGSIKAKFGFLAPSSTTAQRISG